LRLARGEGQVVILAGEAGLGKTRLASELQKRAADGGTTVMRGGCSEADLSLPYLPFTDPGDDGVVVHRWSTNETAAF
jgi:predicted ATPase